MRLVMGCFGRSASHVWLTHRQVLGIPAFVMMASLRVSGATLQLSVRPVTLCVSPAVALPRQIVSAASLAFSLTLELVEDVLPKTWVLAQNPSKSPSHSPMKRWHKICQLSSLPPSRIHNYLILHLQPTRWSPNTSVSSIRGMEKMRGRLQFWAKI